MVPDLEATASQMLSEHLREHTRRLVEEEWSVAEREHFEALALAPAHRTWMNLYGDAIRGDDGRPRCTLDPVRERIEIYARPKIDEIEQDPRGFLRHESRMWHGARRAREELRAVATDSRITDQLRGYLAALPPLGPRPRWVLSATAIWLRAGL